MAEQGNSTTPGRMQALLRNALHALVAMVAALPACLFLWQWIPLTGVPALGGLSMDRLGLFLAVWLLFWFVLRRFTLAGYGAITVVVGIVTFQGVAGGHGFHDLFEAYRNTLSAFSQNTQALPDVSELRPFQGAEELRAAMDFTDPAVRTFAVRAATTWFREAAEESDRTLIQSFSIFKVINNAWVYVSDPSDREYFATAKESIGLLAGDCDDHAVLMASSIKAIGGKVRLVRTTGHIYPELCVGNAQAMQRAAWLIRNVLFPEEARYADLYYHTDANGDRWINLDYTRHYPGGPVMNEKIIGILHV